MNVMDLGFRQGEEKWLSPEKEEVKLLCDGCDKEICENELFLDDGFEILCEDCALDKLYEKMEER